MGTASVRGVLVVTGTVALTTCLVGCGGGSLVMAPAPEPSLLVSSQPSTTSSLPPEDDAVSPPGTALGVGDAATVHVQALEPGDEFYGFAVVETTVTAIERGDPAVFAQLDTPEDYIGKVPYYVRAEHVIRHAEGDPSASMTPVLFPVFESGDDADAAGTSSGFGDACVPQPFPEIAAGQVATTCTVALGEEGGDAVTAVEWRGDDYADGYGQQNEYADNGISWNQ